MDINQVPKLFSDQGWEVFTDADVSEERGDCAAIRKHSDGTIEIAVLDTFNVGPVKFASVRNEELPRLIQELQKML